MPPGASQASLCLPLSVSVTLGGLKSASVLKGENETKLLTVKSKQTRAETAFLPRWHGSALVGAACSVQLSFPLVPSQLQHLYALLNHV